MPVIPKNLLTKYGLNTTKDKGVIGIITVVAMVTIATRYVADAYRPIEPPYPIST